MPKLRRQRRGADAGSALTTASAEMKFVMPPLQDHSEL